MKSCWVSDSVLTQCTSATPADVVATNQIDRLSPLQQWQCKHSTRWTLLRSRITNKFLNENSVHEFGVTFHFQLVRPFYYKQPQLLTSLELSPISLTHEPKHPSPCLNDSKKFKLVMFIFQQSLAQRGFAQRGLYYTTIPTERPPPVGEVSANFCG